MCAALVLRTEVKESLSPQKIALLWNGRVESASSTAENVPELVHAEAGK